MKRIPLRLLVFFIAAFMSVFTVCAAAGETQSEKMPETFLYSVSKAGMPESFLLGTIHVGPEGIDLPELYSAALDRVEVLVVETNITNPKAILSMAIDMMDMESSLSKRLGKKYVAKISKFTGYTASQLDQLLPWAALMLFTSPKQDYLSAMFGIDIMLMEQAKEQGMTLLELETFEDSLGFFINLEQIRIVEMMDYYMENADELVQSTIDMYDLYAERDAEGLMDVAQADDISRYMDDEGFWTNWSYNLIEGRTNNWLPKVKNIMNQQSSLIAVGALHILGEEGLVELLRADGYEVSPVFDLDAVSGTLESLTY